MAVNYPVLHYDLPPVWADVPPITRESFIAAYVDLAPWMTGGDTARAWDLLHSRNVLPGEIDEDPQ